MPDDSPFSGRTWQGLDVLRGLGIFGLLVMHSAFYYFDGLWDLNLENPPLVITVIGFLLMFAGLFAIISGAVHGISIERLSRKRNWTLRDIARKKASSSLFILLTAYVYFLVTGPGLADFANRRMDNSILIEWIQHGQWAGISLDRVLYIDSLVMIGTNILLVSLVWLVLLKTDRLKPSVLLALSGGVMLLSLLRLPLYPVYQSHLDRGNWGPVLLLNGLVNKNNPILPFLAFGLLGSWLGLRLERGLSSRPAFWLALGLLSAGATAYVFLPDTMLQRAIDLKWYSIMVAQLGLFILMFLAAIRLFDRSGGVRQPGFVTLFIRRFGHVGLTAFFWESVVAAFVWRGLKAVFPSIRLDITGSLMFGLALAILWGFILIAWERFRYVGTVEYFYARFVTRFGRASSKALKIGGGEHGHPSQPA